MGEPLPRPPQRRPHSGGVAKRSSRIEAIDREVGQIEAKLLRLRGEIVEVARLSKSAGTDTGRKECSSRWQSLVAEEAHLTEKKVKLEMERAGLD